MSDGERAWHAFSEDFQRQGRRLGGRRVIAFIICNVLTNVMAARSAEQVIQAERLCLDNTPRRNPFPAHTVFIGFGLFEQQHGVSGLRHGRRQGRAANPTSDDDQVVAQFFLPHTSWRA